ncbi:MAG TPA: ABC transporter permease [Magnetospirillaceae bacterium]|jgi:NitT/TauT family transport system permease protein
MSEMERSRLSPLVALILVALPLPLGSIVAAAAGGDNDSGEMTDDSDAKTTPFFLWSSWEIPALFAIVVAAFWMARRKPMSPHAEALWLAPGLLAGATLPLVMIGQGILVGPAIWVFLAGMAVLYWHELSLLSRIEGATRHLVVPGLFGLGLLYVWQVIVQGFDIPAVLLPPPSVIFDSFGQQGAEMWGDFVQTVLKSVIRGYLMGCGLGFVVAILADRVPFFARGLLPFGNLVSALPVVGIAPIMVMWFGFDWQSKAAVVVVMTFFPMLVNTLAGLGESERIQLDLMRSYGAGYWLTLFRLRLPNALPFIFNALKINSTLALIGAIVAEFFGTPIVGMGFRISTSVARMDLGVVWATIVVAALTGSLAYGGLALIERTVTAWHPSYRRR